MADSSANQANQQQAATVQVPDALADPVPFFRAAVRDHYGVAAELLTKKQVTELEDFFDMKTRGTIIQRVTHLISKLPKPWAKVDQDHFVTTFPSPIPVMASQVPTTTSTQAAQPDA